MSTFTGAKPHLKVSRYSGTTRSGLASKFGRTLLGILVGLGVLILCIPILLVAVTTSVPPIVSILLALADVGLLAALLRFERTPLLVGGVLVGLVIISVVAIWVSQMFATTPPMTAPGGKTLANSIAVMEKVQLNGSEQWITIRGKDVNKPVLLYLGIGGPGAGGMPANLLNLAPLEEHFVVVNWDQPGTGKSYGAVPISTLTVDRFVADAHALTELIRARFHQEKIYVMGLSWGTIVGTKLIQQYPDLFYAYLGTGQMVNTTENDVLGYELAVRVATERGDSNLADSLRRNGPPPYDGDGMALKYAAYNNVLFDYMGNARLEMVLLVVPHFAREYGLWDRVNFARGLIESFAVVYPQLRDLDFVTQANKIDVPMYFLHGRNDVNATAALVERYYNALEAPHKELIWIESGHGASAQEIVDTMVNRVLPQTVSKVGSISK